LVEDCPIYSPEAAEDSETVALRAQHPAPGTRHLTPEQTLVRLLDHPPIASKRWVFEQYDSTVQAGTVLPPGGDAGVLRVRHTDFGIAVTTACNARYVRLRPYEGGKAAVAEAARNVACTGARPLGITDCLNFGNPERPAVYFQFREACRGIADACRALETPVTGGNVSFYNESPNGAVDPTPVVGMVGLLDRVDRAVPSHARLPGDRVLILGDTRRELGGSAFWEAVLQCSGGEPPVVDLAAERRIIDLLVDGARQGLFHSAHDCSDGGLGVALAEIAMGGPYQEVGFGIDLDLSGYAPGLDGYELLFSESHGRTVVTCAPEGVAAVEQLARRTGVPVYDAGAVTAPNGTVALRLRDAAISHAVGGLREVYFTAIPKRMGD
jgi:phosphoribosylformylglycinamidine synthase